MVVVVCVTDRMHNFRLDLQPILIRVIFVMTLSKHGWDFFWKSDYTGK